MLFPKGEAHPNWKGGVRKNSDGYIQFSAGPLRGKYVHRVMWEEAHGPIPEGKDVHHRNEIRGDNRLDNFELRDSDSHRREALLAYNSRHKSRKRKDLTQKDRSAYPTARQTRTGKL